MGAGKEGVSKNSISFLLNPSDDGPSSVSEANQFGEGSNEQKQQESSDRKRSPSNQILCMIRGPFPDQTTFSQSAQPIAPVVPSSAAQNNVPTEKRIICELCSESLGEGTNWANHQVRVHHNMNVGSSFKLHACNFAGKCREMFVVKRDRDKHKQMHDCPIKDYAFECKTCHLKVRNTAAMERHLAWGHHSPPQGTQESPTI